MNSLILIVVSTIMLTVTADKLIDRISRNFPNTVQKCPFAKTDNSEYNGCGNRTPCQVNCRNNNNRRSSCNTCNDCDVNEDISEETSINPISNNSNTVNVQSNNANSNPHENRVFINLYNTVHNINNISNPVEITNINHFVHNASVVSSSPCRSDSQCQTEQLQPQRNCSNNAIRPPIILPPYIPPPPPCFRISQFPHISCHQRPAPYAMLNCAPCFYCGGSYKPEVCSLQSNCNSACTSLQCAGGPCYPQLQKRCT